MRMTQRVNRILTGIALGEPTSGDRRTSYARKWVEKWEHKWDGEMYEHPDLPPFPLCCAVRDLYLHEPGEQLVEYDYSVPKKKPKKASAKQPRPTLEEIRRLHPIRRSSPSELRHRTSILPAPRARTPGKRATLPDAE